jgi:poly(hydroxyalkanoate) granule-associated protein
MKSPENPAKSGWQDSREIWLAGLGVFSTMEEEGEKLFKKFVEKGKEMEEFVEKGKEMEEKGETFEKRAKEKVGSMTSYVEEKTGKLTKDVATLPGYVEEKLKTALNKFGASSHSQVKELNDKVDQLTEKVNELIKNIESKSKA